MKITVNQVKIPIKIERKFKLFKINGDKNVIMPRKFDWGILYESSDEHFEDFQIFCLSIAKDLLSKGLETNETGISRFSGQTISPAENALVKYNENSNETTLQDIHNLICMIETKNKK